MIKEIFTKSENFKQEYSATIVKVGELKDIENSNNLKQAIIDGFSIVVNKNDVKEGDLMIYCKNETEINGNFLSTNNMYEIGERQLNANYETVQGLIDEDKKDEAKELVGYFNKYGRVKLLKLRGCPSMGVLLNLENFIKWNKKLSQVNLEDYITYDEHGNFIPFDFDTICDELFIKAYVPRVRVKVNAHHTGNGKRKRKVIKFDRMVDGQWEFHYDTKQMNSNMWRFNPEQVVTISVKLHGTSAIYGNVLVKKPNQLNTNVIKWYNKGIERKINGILKNKRNPYDTRYKKDIERLNSHKAKNYTIGYHNIYSSRRTIKNQFINTNVTSGFYKTDVWYDYNKLLKDIIPQGMTIYGEIVGYKKGTETTIQTNYDYGCSIGENKLMIYRITQKEGETTKEYTPLEVVETTKRLVAKNPKLKGKVIELPIIYHGKFGDLYPDIDIANHWNENILERMKCDTEHFGMELCEPLCNNNVPREGIVIRIDDDEIAEAFKLKCVAFLLKEQKEIDKGNVDIEMMDNYVDEENQ